MARQSQTKRKKLNTPRKHEGRASVFTCPDCQGTLFQIETNGLTQFRCRTGHLYSPQSMLEAQDENVERQLWAAIRALSEQAEYIESMSQELKKEKSEIPEQYAAKGRDAEHNATIIRRLVTHGTEEREPARQVHTKSGRHPG